MTIGEKLKAFLKSEGMTQDGLAASIGWSPTQISNLAAGQKDSLVYRVYHLLRKLGCDIDYLMDDKTGWPPPDKSKNLQLLTNEEMKILSYARDLGYKTAMARLLNIDAERVPLAGPDPTKRPKDDEGDSGKKPRKSG